jgi:hypothetical protein
MSDTRICPGCGEEIKIETITCKHCLTMLSKEGDAQARPERQAEPKKPIGKRWWDWSTVTTVILVLFLFIALLGCGENNSSTSAPSSSTPSEVSQETTDPKTISDEFKPLEIIESSYSIRNEYLFYAVIMHNPNEKLAVEFPSFRITARDENDLLIGTQDQVLSIIYPQQDFAYGSLGFEVDQQPAKVDIEVLEPNDYNITSVEMLEHPIFIPLEIVGVNKRDNSILGEVSNLNDYDIDSAVVTVIFKDADGNIIDGDLTFIDKVPAGGKTPFEIRGYSDWTTDNYDVYANIW